MVGNDATEWARGAVGSRAKRWLRAYLLLLLAIGFTSTEVWPLTSFHLFSSLRDRERSAWQVVSVDAAGEEATVHLSELPIVFQQSALQLDDFGGWSQDRRDEYCDAWVLALRDEGRRTRWIRVYRARYDVIDDRRVDRELRYECGRDRPEREGTP
jgi:hypothetical protein